MISDEVGDSRAWYLGATPLATRAWLVRLRSATAVIQVAVVLVSLGLPALDLPLDHLAPLIMATAVANAATALWLSHHEELPRWVAAAALALDIALLTGLLELTGGPFNPFSVIYVVQVALAVLTLGTWWASALGALAAASFGLVIFWHTQEVVPGHHRLNDFPTHLFTIWTATAATAELVAYFVGQASNALARREQQLEQMRVVAARNERLIALTTLAAGAAHELSTPLGTIAVAARELERAVALHSVAPEIADDARLIRGEVDRCQAILDQLSGRAGGIAVDAPEPVDVTAALSDVRGRLSPERAARLQVQFPGTIGLVTVPRAGFVQAVTSLVKNAFDASAAASLVAVEVSVDRGVLRLTVKDEGGGMAAETLKRAGEPFYTTKEPGRGLGLGLFLARVFAERMGGSLTLHSGRGVTALLELPTGSTIRESA